MGIFGSAVKFIAYPIARPLSDMGKAVSGLRRDAGEIRAARARRWAQQQADIEAAQQNIAAMRESGVLDERIANLKPEEIADPRRIADPSLRFEALVAARQWTTAELKNQLVAVKRTRRAGLGISIACFLVSVSILVLAKTVLGLLLVPVGFMGSCYGLALAMRNGLYQSQLERRRLHNLRDYVGRPDLVRHLFS